VTVKLTDSCPLLHASATRAIPTLAANT